MTEEIPENIEILLVDDDEAIRDSLTFYLKSSGWNITAIDSADKALEMIIDGYGDIVISDIKMPGMDGLEFLGKCKEVNPYLEVLMITGHSNEDLAIEALKQGAYDYFRKPLNAEEIITSLHKTHSLQKIKAENRQLKSVLTMYNENDKNIPFFGDSINGRTMLNQLNVCAKSEDATVLLVGDSGVGKEVAARMIHNMSRPGSSAFMAINCGGLSENLLESELFGHERGSFTGADKQKAGIFELSKGGTVLLDEVSEMSMHAQSRFLRVLEEKSFRRVGGSKDISFEGTRIIAATNKDLHEMIEEGTFRHDLYHRLNIIRIDLPSLSERKDDIVPLAEFFLKRHSKNKGKTYTLVKSAARALQEHDFPGNIRELRNMIERAVVFSQNDQITAIDLGLKANLTPETEGAGMSITTLNLADHEAMLIKLALDQNPNNHSAAARSLGISPQALYRKIEKFGLD